jgi:hypothetical protein
MPAITGAVVVADQRDMLVTDQYQEIDASVTFGNGALTYPPGGIPLTAAQFGFRNFIKAVDFVDPSSGDGYVYKYDQATASIRIYEVGPALSTPLSELGSVAVAATTLQVYARGR